MGIKKWLFAVVLPVVLPCVSGVIPCVYASEYVKLGNPVLGGRLQQWHTVTLTFAGPQTAETAEPNPFIFYRLDVCFSKGVKNFWVPGYYAADGHAGQTGAESGNKWQVLFVPESAGEWHYTAWLRSGRNIVYRQDNPGGPAGLSGKFQVRAATNGFDQRREGFLRHIKGRYLQFSGSGRFYLKGGADSPENLLAYADFDQTFDTDALKRPGEARGGKFIHKYQPHVKDWRKGDPTWKNGKGRGLIGALNYLAGKGMNSVYFITYNIDGGDGKDVWPWISPGERLRFDCSKLDQWRIVLDHMDTLGLAAHIITQETENDQGLDGGELGPQRKLYYRELIARFGHKLSLVWNLGEENTNTTAQQKAFCDYIKRLDPYNHPVVVHTFPGWYDRVYRPLLGFKNFDGASLQMSDQTKTHAETCKWIDLSGITGKAWFVCLDEIGPAHTGVKPDRDDYLHDDVRHYSLWGNLMAGGAGVEWYFGYRYPDNDLTCEDWRSRDHMWDLTRYALQFFQRYIPFQRMYHHDELTEAKDDYCLAAPGEIYAIYLPHGGVARLNLENSPGKYMVQWYNPRKGGPLQEGSIKQVRGPGRILLGYPPCDRNLDWVVLVKCADLISQG